MAVLVSLLLAAAQPPLVQARPIPSPPPATANWRPLGIVQGRFSLAYDTARIWRGPGDLVTIWIKRESLPARSDAPWATSRVELRCATRTMRVVETVTHRADGSIGHDNVPQPFDTIPPASFMEAAHRDVC